MQVDSHVSYYIPLPKLLPSQFDNTLRKDMFSFYVFLEKPIFLSSGEGSGHKMRRNKCVAFMLKIEHDKYIQQILRDAGIF